jgi:hypothetical protein
MKEKEWNMGDEVFFLHKGKVLFGKIQYHYSSMSSLYIISYGDSGYSVETSEILSKMTVCKYRIKKILE